MEHMGRREGEIVEREGYERERERLGEREGVGEREGGRERSGW